MSSATLPDTNATMWAPICCGRVMRHNLFHAAGGSVAAATLSCPGCGKHISLEPQPIGSVQDYGPGARLISLLVAPKGSARKQAAGVSDQPGEDTIV
jgi:hypothetical protein